MDVKGDLQGGRCGKKTEGGGGGGGRGEHNCILGSCLVCTHWLHFCFERWKCAKQDSTVHTKATTILLACPYFMAAGGGGGGVDGGGGGGGGGAEWRSRHNCVSRSCQSSLVYSLTAPLFQHWKCAKQQHSVHKSYCAFGMSLLWDVRFC